MNVEVISPISRFANKRVFQQNRHNPEIAGGGKRSFEPNSEATTADPRIAAVGGAAPNDRSGRTSASCRWQQAAPRPRPTVGQCSESDSNVAFSCHSVAESSQWLLSV